MNARHWLVSAGTAFILAGSPLPGGVAAEVVHTSGVVHTPTPPYPYTARQNREQGYGIVRVTCDATGKAVDVVMARSTGYDDLDENVLAYARAHWSGLPNTRFRVPVDYRLTGPHGGTRDLPKASPGGWYTPIPRYPTDSVRFMESGSGVVKIATDANGRVAKAEMIKSTGARRLDDVTIDYAMGFWKGPPKSIREVPVSYVLKAPHY